MKKKMIRKNDLFCRLFNWVKILTLEYYCSYFFVGLVVKNKNNHAIRDTHKQAHKGSYFNNKKDNKDMLICKNILRYNPFNKIHKK